MIFKATKLHFKIFRSIFQNLNSYSSISSCFQSLTSIREPRRNVWKILDITSTTFLVCHSSAWKTSKIKRHVTVDPRVKTSVFKNYMLETYGLKIHRLALYRARRKARAELEGDQSKGDEKLYQNAAVIHQDDPGALCKVLCDAVSVPEKFFLRDFLCHSLLKEIFAWKVVDLS